MGAAPLALAQPSPSNSSSSVERSEALPENHELHRHHGVMLLEFSLNLSYPLAGSRRRRRPRAVRVLNAEAPLVRRLDRIFRDLNRREYDSINRVLVTLPLSDLQGYEDALPLSLSLLASPRLILVTRRIFLNYYYDPR